MYQNNLKILKKNKYRYKYKSLINNYQNVTNL